MIEIKTYLESDKDEVIRLVLHCQNDGTRPYVTVEEQPDLLCVQEKYMDGGGNFWVAKKNGKVVGTIGLINSGGSIGILKKFFVYEPFRGVPYHLGSKLYATLINFAKASGVKKLILDTPKNTDLAHKFYENAGFRQIKEDQLPIIYDYPYDDSDFFCLEL